MRRPEGGSREGSSPDPWALAARALARVDRACFGGRSPLPETDPFEGGKLSRHDAEDSVPSRRHTGGAYGQDRCWYSNHRNRLGRNRATDVTTHLGGLSMMRAVLKQDVARRQPRTSWRVAAICNVKGALIEAAFPGSTCTNISPSQAQATAILAGIVAVLAVMISPGVRVPFTNHGGSPSDMFVQILQAGPGSERLTKMGTSPLGSEHESPWTLSIHGSMLSPMACRHSFLGRSEEP
jgi:hypothetical protein